MEDVGICHGHFVYILYRHLVCFMDIWYVLWTFDMFCGNLVYLFPVLVCCTQKNLATLFTAVFR
jgi:hypothetical protein